MSADSWAERLCPDRLRKLALGLVLGAVGGAVADYFDVPLAWMLGALFATMFARVAGAPIDVPLWVRANFLILIGLFLGESFEGVKAAELLQWPVSIAAAMLYVPVATACAFLFYRYLAGQQKMTAICSSIPGGLIAVVVVSGSLGADERQVALAQSLRIAIVVVMAPIVAFGLLVLGWLSYRVLDIGAQPVDGALRVADIFVDGTVTGTFADTHPNSGTSQSIQERESGGKPSNRHSFLEHRWTFDVAAGSTEFWIQAWHTDVEYEATRAMILFAL